MSRIIGEHEAGSKYNLVLSPTEMKNCDLTHSLPLIAAAYDLNDYLLPQLVDSFCCSSGGETEFEQLHA